jgi:hypothetical protein
MKEAYRTFRAWEEAITLSQQVHGLIESLPSDEQSALAMSLNSAAVNIPTTIAINLIHMQIPDIRDLVALQTQLELIDRIYPALDTAEVADAASLLLARLLEPARFREAIARSQNVDENDESNETSTVESDADDQDSDMPIQPTRIEVES